MFSVPRLYRVHDRMINEYRGDGGIRILIHTIAMFVNADQ